MKHKISPDLENLLTPIEQLETLPGNPRKGNIKAIAASYEEFGQVKPIVAVENEDGTGTVIAGNHQLQAAKELGWTHIAVLHVPFDHDKAIAFALADNRTSDLGEDDQTLLHDMLMSVVDERPDFFEGLGWDDFEIATIETPTAGSSSVVIPNDGWTPPVMQIPGTEITDETQKSMVTQGATAIDSAGAKTNIQYTLVFNDAEQQSTWYAFLRYLKSNPDFSVLPTTAEQIIAFINKQITVE
mgnify:FL=1|tara:strand:- start:1336 stop:2061 length:726 start_codon:yes stop_codon:yes gene_type:complete